MSRTRGVAATRTGVFRVRRQRWPTRYGRRCRVLVSDTDRSRSALATAAARRRIERTKVSHEIESETTDNREGKNNGNTRQHELPPTLRGSRLVLEVIYIVGIERLISLILGNKSVIKDETPGAGRLRRTVIRKCLCHC
jgi:hypothetical protein